MKKFLILALLSITFISCTTESLSESVAENPPTATNGLLIVSDTNIPAPQNELLIFVNGSGSSRVSANVKVGDVVIIQSNSPAPTNTQYHISVMIGSKSVVTNYTTPPNERMQWTYTITPQDFQL